MAASARPSATAFSASSASSDGRRSDVRVVPAQQALDEEAGRKGDHPPPQVVQIRERLVTTADDHIGRGRIGLGEEQIGAPLLGGDDVEHQVEPFVADPVHEDVPVRPGLILDPQTELVGQQVQIVDREAARLAIAVEIEGRPVLLVVGADDGVLAQPGALGLGQGDVGARRRRPVRRLGTSRPQGDREQRQGNDDRRAKGRHRGVSRTAATRSSRCSGSIGLRR
jgi:hypothetical protein